MDLEMSNRKKPSTLERQKKYQVEVRSRSRKTAKVEMKDILKGVLSFLRYSNIASVTKYRRYKDYIGLPTPGLVCDTKPEDYRDYVKSYGKGKRVLAKEVKFYGPLVLEAHKKELTAWENCIVNLTPRMISFLKEKFDLKFSKDEVGKILKILVAGINDIKFEQKVRQESASLIFRGTSKALFIKSGTFFNEMGECSKVSQIDLDMLKANPQAIEILTKFLVPFIHKLLSDCHEIFNDEPPFFQCKECKMLDFNLGKRFGAKFCDHKCRKAPLTRHRRLFPKRTVRINTNKSNL